MPAAGHAITAALESGGCVTGVTGWASPRDFSSAGTWPHLWSCVAGSCSSQRGKHGAPGHSQRRDTAWGEEIHVSLYDLMTVWFLVPMSTVITSEDGIKGLGQNTVDFASSYMFFHHVASRVQQRAKFHTEQKRGRVPSLLVPMACLASSLSCPDGVPPPARAGSVSVCLGHCRAFIFKGHFSWV